MKEQYDTLPQTLLVPPPQKMSLLSLVISWGEGVLSQNSKSKDDRTLKWHLELK